MIKRIFAVVSLLMLLISTCYAAPTETITKMSVQQFVQKYNESTQIMLPEDWRDKHDLRIKNAYFWHETSGQQVYRCEFDIMGNQKARMYICTQNNEIKQLLFICKHNNTRNIDFTVIKVAISLHALGVERREIYDKIIDSVHDNYRDIYAWSDQEDLLLRVAADDTPTELNFHIIKG